MIYIVYLYSLIKKIKTMTAKELKVGMTIKQGKWSMLVESLENSKQKNGTETIIVKGIVNDGLKNKLGKTRPEYKSERVYKNLTKINIL